MNNTGSRKPRRSFEGTGVYIALFLVVTALAVAGYWTLLPSSTPVQTPAVAETPVPAPAKPQTAAPPAGRSSEPAHPSVPERIVEPAAPAQSVTTVTIAPEPRADFTPAAPALVVAPLTGETIAAFSMDALVYSETMGDWRTHDGMDIAAEAGTQVCAASAGTVIDVRDDDLLGTTVVISHDGGYDTVYANLQSDPPVEVGDFVSAGQVIGSVGRTALGESAMAPHLHFAVTKDGEFVDPAEYLG